MQIILVSGVVCYVILFLRGTFMTYFNNFIIIDCDFSLLWSQLAQDVFDSLRVELTSYGSKFEKTLHH